MMPPLPPAPPISCVVAVTTPEAIFEGNEYVVFGCLIEYASLLCTGAIMAAA